MVVCRIKEEQNEQADKLRSIISQTSSRLFKAENEGKDTQPYTNEIKRLKEELSKIMGCWSDSLVFEWSLAKDTKMYVCDAKHGNKVTQISFDKYEGLYTSANMSEKATTIKEMKVIVEDHIKFMWQL